MKTIAILIWFWGLTILPFTSILTFILTLVVCSQVQNNAPFDETPPEISYLGTGQAHIYFIIGFVILCPQVLLIALGRLQFLFQTQLIINRIFLYVVHFLVFIACIFMLIMAIASLDDQCDLHRIGTRGLFACILLYGILHTSIIIYLFKHRSKAPQHSNIIYSIWFVVCSLLVIIFYFIWSSTDLAVPQYIAAGSPFLYFLGFVPQFWSQARAIKQDSVTPKPEMEEGAIDTNAQTLL
jgi:hypothetical protein